MIPEKDFSKLEFNPLVKGKVLDKYPKLRATIGDADDKMVRYVILMYDINSPLKSHYPELNKRKEFAADLAGYNVSDDLTSIFDFKLEDKPNEELLDITMKYLKYQNNMVWQMIISNEQAFNEYNRRVMMPVDGNRDKDILQAVEIKTKIMESMDVIYQRIQRYTKEMFGGDESLEDVITKRKRIRPEEVAANVQNNR